MQNAICDNMYEQSRRFTFEHGLRPDLLLESKLGGTIASGVRDDLQDKESP